MGKTMLKTGIKNSSIMYKTWIWMAIYREEVPNGQSPDLEVNGEYWWSRGCEFESMHLILDVSFFTFICCKILSQEETKHKIERVSGSVWPDVRLKNFQNSPNVDQ